MTTKKAILCLGIDRFDDAITPLLGAANDARQWCGFFEHRLGFTAKLLTHEELEAGKKVMRSIRELMQPLGEGDLFGLFIATHGKSLVTGPGGQRDQAFLLPDASRRSLDDGIVAGEGMLTLGQLERETAKAGVQRFFIIDACRSPIERETADTRDGELDLAFDGEAIYRDLAIRSQRVGSESSPLAIFNSCPDRQRAVELRSLRRGLFSVAAQQKLKERIDAGLPLDLNDALVEDIARCMQSTAAEHKLKVDGQRPSRQGAVIRLWSGEDRQALEQRRLEAEFEQRFAAGLFFKPYGQSANDTLQRLAALGLRGADYDARFERLLDARRQQESSVDEQSDARVVAAAQALESEAGWTNVYINARSEATRAHATQAMQRLRDAAAAAAEQAAAEAQAEAEAQAKAEAKARARADAAAAAKLQRQQAAKEAEDLRLQAESAWNRAQLVGSIAAFEEYRAQWPQGEHADAARDEVRALKAKARARTNANANATAKATVSDTGAEPWPFKPAQTSEPASATSQPKKKWQPWAGAGVGGLVLAITALWPLGGRDRPVAVSGTSTPQATASPATAVLMPHAPIPTEPNKQAPEARASNSEVDAYLSARAGLMRSAWWREGKGSAPDGAQQLLRQADRLADMGVSEAMLDAAAALAAGRGLPRDEAKAAQRYALWLSRAGGRAPASQLARVQDDFSEVLLQGLARPSAAKAWQAVTQALAPYKAFPVDYWRGLLAKCGSEQPDLPAAREAFKRLQQATASGEQGPIYKEAAAQQLAALAQPCAPKVGESLPAAKAGAAKGQQPARAPAASPKTGLDPAAAWPFPTGHKP